MKLFLFGYGKMGSLIAQEAQACGHEIIGIVRRENRATLQPDDLRPADVAIDFTTPEAAVANALLCLDARLPVVIGTTGWHAEIDNLRRATEAKQGSLLYGSNFSIGMNMVFLLNRHLAQWMRGRTAFSPHILEIHHQSKKDAPSGTAITLARDILTHSQLRHSWAPEAQARADQLPVASVRDADHVGEHVVTYRSDGEVIQLRHQALSRRIFAQGALVAAEWLLPRKGFYHFTDLFSLHI